MKPLTAILTIIFFVIFVAFCVAFGALIVLGLSWCIAHLLGSPESTLTYTQSVIIMLIILLAQVVFKVKS